MTNQVKVGAGETAPVATKTYAAMLYALAAEMRKEEGCVTESPELVEQAATRLDEQTVTINELRRQRGVLLDALHVALPFVEDHEGDQCYKPGAVSKAVATIKAAIATTGCKA